MSDDYLEEIKRRLAGELDPKTFESAVSDLLSGEFPGLAPVPGGSDGGIDAAIPSEDQILPLIATTDSDPARNLRRSLKAIRDRGEEPKKAVFVTSQSVTPQRQQALKKIAREFGVPWLQIFEREGVANRLYRNSRWSKQLLGVTGSPPALSEVPLTRRPLLDMPLVGREKELEWLKTTTGDRVISGEPGSGKTFLLHKFSRDGGGLFVVDKELSRIANALRERSPEALFVDDAHLDTTFLTRLAQARSDLDQNFSIVATTWEGGRDAVADALGHLPHSRVRKLELLTRAQILAIIQQAGVQASDEILREIVDQAANKPGLAVTLSQLWLQGAWQEVLEGGAISRSLLAALEELVGPESRQLLAAFGLGGSRGIPLEAAGRFLGIGRAKAQSMAAALAAGGVLSESSSDTLSVWPEVIRSVLLREVFFTGSGTDLPYQQLLAAAPSLPSAAMAIAKSAAYGAKIPDEELRGIVLQAGSSEVWRQYTVLGESQAAWALDHYPNGLLQIAKEALLVIPGSVIPRLLEAALEASGPLHSQPSHPLRILQDWVSDIVLPLGKCIERRRLLARATAAYLEQGGDYEIGVQAMCLALSPTLSGSTVDPGKGNAIKLSFGLLPAQQLSEMPGIWDEVRRHIHDIDGPTWQHVKGVLWDWIHPRYAAKLGTATDEQAMTMRSVAAQILTDLVPLTRGSPGLKASLERLARRIPIELDLPSDNLFDLLYPPDAETADAHTQQEKEQAARVTQLAGRWAKRVPQEAVQELLHYEAEARKVGKEWPRWTPFLCTRLAQLVHERRLWLDELLAHQARADLVEPFLTDFLDNRPAGWENTACQLLDRQEYAGTALYLLLQSDSLPSHVLEATLKKASDFPQLVETCCLRRQVPTQTLRLLLRHEDPWTALAAAIGEWNAEPSGEVDDRVKEDWRQAVLHSKEPDSGPARSGTFSYWLGHILAAESDLAYEWLRRRLLDPEARLYSLVRGDDDVSANTPAEMAIDVLDGDQRRELLELAAGKDAAGSLIARLVGRDPAIYGELLALKSASSAHLEPLMRKPDEHWRALAQLALDHGVDPERVAAASFWASHTIVGFGVEHWQEWEKSFAALESDPNPTMRSVAREGLRRARQKITQAEREKRQANLHGF